MTGNFEYVYEYLKEIPGVKIDFFLNPNFFKDLSLKDTFLISWKCGKAKVILVSGDEKVRRAFEEDRLFFERLASASELVLQADKEGIGDGTVSVVLPFATAFIPLADLLDVQAEIARLQKEKKRLEGELKRSAGMLRNEKFLAKAPADKIAAEKEKQARYEQQMAGVERELEELAKL